MEPEDIPLGWYTHINFAFALVNPKTFRIAPMDDGTASRYQRVSALKLNQPSLKVWIAIGGWAMNDPGPYRTAFSDLAKSPDAQQKFFASLITFLVSNNFDGVDLDWEYPVADDRGGISERLQELRHVHLEPEERTEQQWPQVRAVHHTAGPVLVPPRLRHRAPRALR